MPLALALVLIAATFPALGENINLCFNYECRSNLALELDNSELRRAARLFVDVGDAAAEREAIRHAVAALAGIAASRSPIANDKGGNIADEGVDGRMDCIDHSRTTTEYLQLLERRHWLRFHRVLAPVVRAPLLLNVHWAARIEDKQSGEQFVVDTWFKPNGFPAALFALESWRKGAVPDDGQTATDVTHSDRPRGPAPPDG